MALTTLVVCNDPELLQRIIPVFELAGIQTEVCTRALDAEKRLALARFDAALIDCAGLPGARAVLDSVRQSGTNRSSVTFAIVSEITSPREAAALGASFVLERSFTQDWLLHNLRAAQGLMALENRRYFRMDVDFVAWIQRPSDRGAEVPVTCDNLSQGGIGIVTTLALQSKTLIDIRFSLPGSIPIDAQAEVMWCREGKAGLRFTKMSSKSRTAVVSWLMEEYERTQPAIPTIPAAMSASARAEKALLQGRRLLCHAFAQNLPIAWKCSDCGWRTSIRLEETRWRYANEPPEQVVAAFQSHDCSAYRATGSVFAEKSRN